MPSPQLSRAPLQKRILWRCKGRKAPRAQQARWGKRREEKFMAGLMALFNENGASRETMLVVEPLHGETIDGEVHV